MPEQARLYDLMLVLSTTAEDERRAKILSDVEAQITSGGGTIERNDDWHSRPLAYEINHQAEGEYHLLQFTGPTSLLDDAVAQPAHRRRRAALPDHQGGAGDASGARVGSPGDGGRARPGRCRRRSGGSSRLPSKKQPRSCAWARRREGARA